MRPSARGSRPPMRRCSDANRGFLRGPEPAFPANARCAMMLGKLFRTGGGNHASLYSPNPCRGGVDLFQRARCCIGADCNNSKRHSSFSRTFNPSHFYCHELHDVLQLAVGELTNTLRLTHTAGSPPSPSFSPAPILNDTANGACLSGCTSTQLTCQTNCSLQSSQIGQ